MRKLIPISDKTLSDFMTSAEQFENLIKHLEEQTQKMKTMGNKMGKTYSYYYETCYSFKKSISNVLQETALSYQGSVQSIKYYKNFYNKAKKYLNSLGLPAMNLSYMKQTDFETSK